MFNQTIAHMYLYDHVAAPDIFQIMFQKRCLAGAIYETLNTLPLYDPLVDYYVTVELPRYCKIVAKENSIVRVN